MAEKLPSWIERLLLPRLSEISGELKAVNTRIGALEQVFNERFTRLDEKITGLRNEMVSKFEAVNTRIDSLEKRNTRG